MDNMIRFVELRGFHLGYRFAFWDTVHDCFCPFHSSWAWDTANEFLEDITASTGYDADEDYVRRFMKKIPQWAFQAGHRCVCHHCGHRAGEQVTGE